MTDEITELEALESTAKMPNVKTLLRNEINRLKNRTQAMKAEVERLKSSDNLGGVISVTDYAWDQNDQVVKFYIELSKLDKVDASQVVLKINDDHKGFTCVFGKHRFTVARLYDAVDEAKSSTKVLTKSNRLLITLGKAEAKTWPSITPSKASSFIAKKDEADEAPFPDDPSAGLMSLMKKMYDEGDDDMKRTLAKTWYESQKKQGAEGFPSPFQ